MVLSFYLPINLLHMTGKLFEEILYIGVLSIGSLSIRAAGLHTPPKRKSLKKNKYLVKKN
jgi:hypothetical protein